MRPDQYAWSLAPAAGFAAEAGAPGVVFPAGVVAESGGATPLEMSGFKSLLVMTFAGLFTSFRRASSVRATSANGRVADDCAEAGEAQITTSAAEMAIWRFMISFIGLSSERKSPFRKFSWNQLA
jgi:hypothetical protein